MFDELEEWKLVLLATLTRNGDKIPAIKLLRAWTDCGLKEGKDEVERLAVSKIASIPANIASDYFNAYQSMQRARENVQSAVWWNTYYKEEQQ
jgi:hypothetical protein